MLKLNLQRFVVSLLIISTGTSLCFARQLRVGTGHQYATVYEASQQAIPGDTILISAGTYQGEPVIRNLRGTAQAPIVIRGEGKVLFEGSADALHFSDPSYIIIEGLVFDKQTANGVNIDDGGSFDSPAHHIVIQNCEWKGMDASGNNDELKISGLDDFVIRNCRFTNGSKGGSFIDMVGCHRGVIENNTFERGGSNSIQAKGGTRDITIQRNRFVEGGERGVNIGGSTGAAYFRPQGSIFESSDIKVWSNIFIGGVVPVAFVGTVNSQVVNNTIILPQKWVVRILQENKSAGMQLCAQNVFRNNIVLLTDEVSVAVNVGPDTDPGSFIFSNNLWYNQENTSWQGPNVPVKETNTILNADPLFSDKEYRLKPNSPAVGKGYESSSPATDFFNRPFRQKRSIGAVEIR